MNIKKLLDTLRPETDALYWIILEQLKALGMNPEFDFDNWIYVNNNSPIMLVAHIDTITRKKKLKFRVKRNRITARNSVLGADDRAGVYAILEILSMCKHSNVPMPSILFTNYEESGMQGVEEFVKSNKMEKNMNIFIELDRKGKDEYVYYFNGMPKPVSDWVESFGYAENYGSMSDVMTLTCEYNIPHVNLSVGYYNQHTANEVLRPSELQLNIDRVFQMIVNPIDKLYEVDGKASNIYDDYIDDYWSCKYGGHGIWRNHSKKYNVIKEDIYYDSKTCIPKSFVYNKETDSLDEIEYECESSDIPWEYSDDNLDINNRYTGIHEMSEQEYYAMQHDYYGNPAW